MTTISGLTTAAGHLEIGFGYYVDRRRNAKLNIRPVMDLFIEMNIFEGVGRHLDFKELYTESDVLFSSLRCAKEAYRF